jgi:hypothetical protein
MDDRIFLLNCKSYQEILDRLPAVMEPFKDLFPADNGRGICITASFDACRKNIHGNLWLQSVFISS